MKREIRIFLTLAAAGLLAGCMSPKGGDFVFIEGSLRGPLQAKPQKIVAAADKGFADLQWARVTAKASVTEGNALGETANGDKVVVKAKIKDSTTSVISIRIGATGDEDLSRLLLERIKVHLQ